MWLRHWNLARDPFPAGGGGYVATPGHDEAAARLAHAIGSGERRIALRGDAGTGKSMVLGRALVLAKTPTLRVATAIAPADGPSLLADLARSLRLRVAPGPAASQCWRSLADAARLIRIQRGRLVLIVDAAEHLTCRRELDRLVHLDAGADGVVSLIVVGPGECEDDPGDEFLIELDRLNRGESHAYLAAKLGLAGRDAPSFTSTAQTRLHAMSDGIPRRLDRLAGLALRGAAALGLSAVTAELVGSLERDHNLIGPNVPAAIESGRIGRGKRGGDASDSDGGAGDGRGGPGWREVVG